MSASRRFDVICVGRAAVDLYGEQIGGRLEDMLTFAKYLGGSPANTAIGAARLGLKPAMLTRVGDEHNGRFVRETLAAEGVDVSHVITDPKRLTALAILGIRDGETFPLLFYRDSCADMNIAAGDFDAQFLASSVALCISGTHLSQPQTYAACVAAMRGARAAGTRVALDIDYRPVLWGLTSPGLGRAALRAVGRRQRPSANGDSVVRPRGRHRGGSPHRRRQHRHDRRAAAPARIDARHAGRQARADGLRRVCRRDSGQPRRRPRGPGFPVDVFNILGAGDAFMAGFLRGWIRDEPLERCCA